MNLYELKCRTRAYGVSRRWRDAFGLWRSEAKHKGDDYAATYGHDPVYAIQPGKVVAVGWSPIFGYFLQVRRDAFVVVKYHMFERQPAFVKGDQILPGDYLGRTGASADNASGNHIHIQVERLYFTVDPRPFVTEYLGTPASAGAVAFPTNPEPFEEDDMFTDQDRAEAAETLRLLRTRNLPVLVKTGRSNKVWLSDLVVRRLVASEDELARTKGSLQSRSLSTVVNVVADLDVFGVPVLTDAQRESLTQAQIDGEA
ncbi:M23 family metallopeptidase [Mycetocola miduiensis]|uniref:Peptidase family M23 n=1 Tax=Mycetocola miduiensis TaxID=995034 RepID=A0A1I5AU80_9MICO|nr:M23 family metallopeptidase [Mycetocola miduiensis]SFN65952.1 Peptidase family M23 [Mycetocola miduiensis]